MTDSLKTQLRNLEDVRMVFKEDGTKFKMFVANGTIYNINPEVYMLLSRLCANAIPAIGIAAQPAKLIVDRRIIEACKKRKDIENSTGAEEYTPYLTVGDEDSLRIFDEAQDEMNTYLKGDC